jgi:hypothetical protein
MRQQTASTLDVKQMCSSKSIKVEGKSRIRLTETGDLGYGFHEQRPRLVYVFCGG